MASASTPEAQALLEKWRSEEDFDERDELLRQLQASGIFPSEYEDGLELESGLYPDLNDPQFLPKLLRKREFQESKQKTIAESLAEGVDKCRSSEDFELSSVQRFVSRVMSPRTPYNSSLFYHGVGVGKTCAAITVCESYLEAYPGRKVYIVAPPNIQEGFRRTIFDREGLRLGKGTAHNSHRGCTGDIYLALTNTLTERDPKVIEQKVAKAIKTRYEFFGYTSFYNHIRRTMSKIPAGIGAVESETLKRTILRNEFSNRVIIIDEAHNLRDVLTEADDDSKDDMGPIEDSKGGKKLTPFLQEVLEVSEGITLVLMTATPMYNSYAEIVFLLNLLLTNDKFPRLALEDVFDLKRETFNDAKGGRKLLGKIASCYVSFMRGENPLTFPLRLEPVDEAKVTEWCGLSPKRVALTPAERERVAKLPCIAASFSPEVEALYKETAESIIASAEGLGITNMDLLIQAGNWIFPSTEGSEGDILDRIRQGGFDSVFAKEKRGSSVQFRCQEDIGAEWLLEDNLPSASGKCALLINRLNNSKGVMFVYSRFVASGALSIALALEANGYTPAVGGPLLADGNQHPDGRQCALCERKERGHGKEHAFKPSKYVLLTGSEEISPNNAASINAARAASNKNGEDVKVVIGSQIAGEGLDLRYVREVVVFDSWYHLNKLEQIIGRGIRNCSHAALDEEKRNCTVSLLVNEYASEPDLETIDMYSYRNALKKAVTVGNVTRVLKEYAMDCTLNKDAIVVEGLDPLPRLYDSQGLLRENVSRNDTPLTSMCDWLDKCQYDCLVTDKVGIVDGSWTQDAFSSGEGEGKMPEAVTLELQDSSTYDEYTARYHLNTLRKYIQELFGEANQSYITFEDVQSHFNTIPRPLLASLMAEMIQKKEMKIRIEREGSLQDGRVIYKNGFYLFQPDKIKDTSIPIAIRVAAIPISRDHYAPKAITAKKEELVVGEEVSKKIAIGSEDSEALWEEVLEWSTSIRDGTADSLPDSLVTEVSNLRESSGIMKAQKERLEMILWVYSTIKDKPAALAIFADCVIDFFWDEFITHGTKRELLSLRPQDPVIRAVAKDMYWTLQGNTYIRFLAHDNKIEYICVAADGTTSPCSRAVSEVLQREVDEDPVLKRPLDVRTTGYEYGFILYNPKKTKFIYKKGKPPMPKGKVGRGSECSINSKIAYELKLLEKFGTSLTSATPPQPDLGLSAEGLAQRRIQNSVRICTVCDLVQRFMDKARIGGKRWFYRPLEAKLYGHPLR